MITKKSCNLIEIPEEFAEKDEDGNNLFDIEAADDLFKEDIVRFEEAVRALGVQLYQHEFYALTNLSYNMETSGFNNTPNLVKALKAGDYENAAPEFLDITNGGDKGLKRRRQAEFNIFTKNHYENN
ncbi:lysozyme [Thorsellia anophelis]|uniref:Lysozyme n=1 Tax=Thorsellia anophelis DSM 18579 TaxID=1123402 RepID=A0A1I0EC53_9GAMM|nr:lysozyme [Thorsellia anophelis]SET42860.1 Phage lysozyme [Thorsellia anophelis DSM 18579]